jgi:hypothetical protein
VWSLFSSMYLYVINNNGEYYFSLFLYFAGTKENKYANTQNI